MFFNFVALRYAAMFVVFKQKKCEVYLSSIASSKAWGREKITCDISN